MLTPPTDNESNIREEGVGSLPKAIVGAIRIVWRAAAGDFTLTIALQAAGGVLLGAEVVIISSLLQVVVKPHSDLGIAGLLIVVMALVFAAIGVTGSISTETRFVISVLVTRYISEQLVSVTSSVPLARFDDARFYDDVARAHRAQSRPFVLTQNLVTALQGVINTITVSIGLAVVNPILIPILIFAFAPIAVASMARSRELYAFLTANTAAERRRDYLQQLLSDRDAAKEIRAYGSANYLLRMYRSLWSDYVVRLRRIVRRQGIRAIVSNVLAGILSAVVIGGIVYLLTQGSLTVAQAGAALTAAAFLAVSLPQVVTAAGGLLENALFLSDYHAFMSDNASTVELSSTPIVEDPLKDLEVGAVTFKYCGASVEAVKGVSVSVKAGQVVALVGENGSGKTTLAKLIAGLYVPSSGRLAWNGHTLSPGELRSRVSVIFQDFVQYDLTARENIGLGWQQKMDDANAVEEAAVRSGASEFITRLPRKYDTVLSEKFEGGVQLSVGQWQRVALARAFFRDHTSLIILDEPTAALDPRAEANLFEHMRELAKGKGVILISHRFSSVRAADHIYVMSDGAIVEHGDHDALMAMDGSYAELVRLQESAILAGEGGDG